MRASELGRGLGLALCIAFMPVPGGRLHRPPLSADLLIDLDQIQGN